MELMDKNNNRKRSLIWNFSVEEIIQFFEDSQDEGLVGVFRRMGYNEGGGKYTTLHKRMSDAGIDIEKYKYSKKQKPRTNDNHLIFCQNSDRSRTVVRKRVLDERLIEYICVKCGNTGEWMGEPITLQLEHKNGINNDNRLDNLCFLCPNCHCQTSTWGGKNVKKGRKEKPKCLSETCDNIVYKEGSKCKKCHGIAIRKTSRPTYDDLSKSILENGYDGSGIIYGVYGTTVKKWLQDYEKENAKNSGEKSL